MTIAAPTFTGFSPDADRLPRGARPEQRPRVVPAAQGRLRAPAQGAAGGARRGPGRAVRGARHPPPSRPEALDLPDLPRHPVRQGQVALQDPPGREFPWLEPGPDGGRRPRAWPTRTAATSISSPGTITSAAGCTWPRSPGSTPSGERSSKIQTRSAPRSRTPGSWRRSAPISQPRASSSGSRRAARRTIRWPSCSATRTSSSGAT